ncbi:hypothetical protein FSO04_24315 [Paraburkholderia madseniana]|uniref:Uncharacterized protein n=1 Tax=Paraburkholderia madseniana TaxID=2599607 RepID=A0A6N6W9K6_9BURK|nr:hypothetical protein [Paraburkholderia madseniana]KAE8757347.1 hypothetical protein FSO04_24315 [Paraburkholderia madseniana]
MRDFGAWFSEQGKSEPVEIDGSAWMKCCGCGKEETVNLKAYENGDTGWYVDDEVEPDGTYEGVCGGSDRCIP